MAEFKNELILQTESGQSVTLDLRNALLLAAAPTAATAARAGMQAYVVSGGVITAEYVCTAAAGGVYTWVEREISGGGGVFTAVYGETAYSDIRAAYDSGMVVMVKKDNLLFVPGGVSDSRMFFFNKSSEVFSRVNVGGDNIWLESSRTEESTANKVTEITEEATDTQYPSAKAVSTSLNELNASVNKSLDELYVTEQEIVGGSKNIFNPNAVVHNKTYDWDVGDFVDTTDNQTISQTFEIRKGETSITISYVTGGGVHQLQSFTTVFYDSAMNNIQVATNSTHTIPANASYFIINLGSVFNSALNRIMVEYGDTMSEFEEYLEPETVEHVYIKPERLSFMDKGISSNNYNYKTRTDDATMNTDGSVTTSTYRSVSDFIPCHGKSVFSISSGAEGVYCFYDNGKNFISPYGVFSNGKEGLVIPTNAYYLRVSFLKSAAYTLVVSFTESAIPYEKYNSTYWNLQSDFDKNNCKSIIADVLINGSTIKFLGDSITQGVGGTGFAQDGEEIQSGWNVNTNGYCFVNLFKDYIESKYTNTVINYGTKGIRSYDIVSWLANNDGYITDNDKLLIIMIGTNNKWASTTDTLVDLKNDIQWIIDWCAENDKKLILISAPMSSTLYDTQGSDGTPVKFHNDDIDHIYKEIAYKNNMDYVPMYQRMMEYCDLKNIDIDTIFDDGLHPNDEGYYIMYKILMKELGVAYQYRSV